MNTEQWMAMLRILLPLLGGVAIALGWLTQDQVSKWVETILQIAGPVLTLIGVAWALWVNTQVNLVTAVADMPEVKKIEIQPATRTEVSQQHANALVAETPDNVVHAA